MPKTRSAKKRMRQNEKRRVRNRAIESRTRTQVKKVMSALAAGDVEKVKKEFLLAESRLDKAASKGVLHRNTASRKKSRLAAKVNALLKQAELAK
jgi:small subunit ribosomal protein S20